MARARVDGRRHSATAAAAFATTLHRSRVALPSLPCGHHGASTGGRRHLARDLTGRAARRHAAPIRRARPARGTARLRSGCRPVVARSASAASTSFAPAVAAPFECIVCAAGDAYARAARAPLRLGQDERRQPEGGGSSRPAGHARTRRALSSCVTAIRHDPIH